MTSLLPQPWGMSELGGETRVVSVLFVDIVGSTTMATEREPAEVVALLNRFFGVVVEEVDRHAGLVNKFIGDAALAVFGAPVELDDHATRALATGRAMAARLAEEVPELDAGIGVATGEAVAGNVGDESRFEYTVIGDAVNAAARISDLAKKVDGRLLAAHGVGGGCGPRRGGPVERARDGDVARTRHRDGARRTEGVSDQRGDRPRPRPPDRADVGTVRRTARRAAARVPGQRAHLASPRPRPGRRGLPGGGAVHARLRAVRASPRTAAPTSAR